MKKFQNFDQGKGLYSLDPKRNSDASPNQFFIVVPRSAIKLFFSLVKIIQKNWIKASNPIMVMPKLKIMPITSIWNPRIAKDFLYSDLIDI
jgi:hypothetical protein